MFGLLRRFQASPSEPPVLAERVYLRAPLMDDYPMWSDLRHRSQEFLAPWEPTWPRDDLKRGAFRRRIKRAKAEMRADRGYPFFLFARDDDRLLGGLTLSNIRRGVTQTCTLGYWVGAPHARQGYMSEAVATIVGLSFGSLRLHRIEAACLPENAASIRLLEKTGFQHEGYARKFLRINGRWRDHLLFARLAGELAAEIGMKDDGAERKVAGSGGSEGKAPL